MKAQRELYLTEVPHKGDFLSFRFPAFIGELSEVARQIDEEGLLRPTSAQTSSLIYDALQNIKGNFESQILKPEGGCACGFEFTGNLFLPKNPGQEVQGGILVEDNPQIKKGTFFMDKLDLIQRLKNNDPSVRFVPYGYKIGEQSIDDLRKNPYLIAQYGEEGADKLAEFASKYMKLPCINQHSPAKVEQIRRNMLHPFHLRKDPFPEGLSIYSCPPNFGKGHAFGVKRQG